MNILITGNMGYVGPALIRHLRATIPSARLVGFDSGYFAECLTGTSQPPEKQLDEQHIGDVRNFPTRILTNTDAIIHLAAISNDPMGQTFEAVTHEINHLATIQLAQRAKASGVRSFIFASSCSAYGFAEDGARTEMSTLQPLTAYAKSKVCTETALQQLAAPHFTITCLRFGTACGMSDRLRLDLVLNDFVASAIATRWVQVLSDGTAWRPLIHVSDMARAFEWALQRTPSNGGDLLVVNTGTNTWNYQVKALAEAVARFIPGTEVSINKHAQPDKRSYRVDFSLFRRLAPEYQPRTTLENAIFELRDGLTAMAFNDADFRNSKLIRLQMLLLLRSRGQLNEELRWRKATTSTA